MGSETQMFENSTPALGPKAGYVSEYDDSLSIDLERYWQRALDLKVWLLGLLVVAILGGVLATLLTTPKFRATARIEINRVDIGATDLSGTAVEGEARDQQYYQTQYELLRSRFMAERVVRSQNLGANEDFLKATGLAAGTPGINRSAASALRSRVEIEPIEQSNLVDIKVSSASKVLAAELANSWANQFLEANYEKRFGDTLIARNQLEKQLAEQREKLELSEASLIGYANENEIVVLDRAGTGQDGESGGGTLVSVELSSLADALAAATARRIAAASTARTGADAAVLASGAGMRSRLAEARAELANLRTVFGDRYPQIVALRAQIASFEASLSAETSSSVTAQSAQLRKASLEEDQLRARFEAAKSAYLNEQGQGVQYGILKREVDTNRELYEALLQRFKELGIARAGNNNMTLIEQADVPSSPYEPSLLLNLLIALGLTALIAGIWVFLAETLDQSIRDPSDLKNAFGLPTLGLIPTVESDSISDQLQDTHSELSEAYSSARTSLIFATPDGAPKSVMMTSTRPEEGKTLSALAIAQSFSKLGKSVLLIDLDLRRMGLSTRLGALHVKNGMSAFLAGQVPEPEILKLEDYAVDFAPAGRLSPNPTELLASVRTRGFIRAMGDKYDQIIIDGPPVLGLSDALELSKAVDGVAYVIQANAGTRRAVTRALNRLRGADANLLGGIVTQLDQRNERYGYGSDYGYGYGYRSEGITS